MTAPAHKNSLVFGIPGSGKTQVLLNRAVYLVQSCGIPAQNIHIFVVTDVIEKFIRWEFRGMDYPEENVTVFDHWCRHFYSNHISRDLPRIYIDGRVDDKKARYSVLSILKNNEKQQKNMKFVLVDDGQDLPTEALEILSLAAQHITVYSDPIPNSCPGISPESSIRNILKSDRSNFSLRGDFRCPYNVAQLASLFIDGKDFRQIYLTDDRHEKGVPESLLCFVARSDENELNHLCEVIRQRQAMNDKVGILVPVSGLVHKMAKVLEDRGIETEKAIPLDAQNVIHEPYDFDSSLPKITTYPWAKGLTFDSVLMPLLTENAFSKIPPFLRHRNLFVGITRASKWVYLSTVKEQEFREMTRLKSAAIEGKIKILNKTQSIR